MTAPVIFSSEQIKYITNPNLTDTKLIACAGSGKTTCIIARIDHMIQHLNVPIDSIFLMTFSRLASLEFKKKAWKMAMTQHSQDSIAHLNTCTIDSLAYKLLHLCGIDNSNVSLLSFEFNQLFTNAPRTVINALVTNAISLDHIFVDEAQDLNNVQYDILMNFKRHANSNIHLIGDPNQTIYQFRRSNSKYLLNAVAAEYELSINYRSSTCIIDFAQSIKPISNTKHSRAGKLVVGQPVVMLRYDAAVTCSVDLITTEASSVSQVHPKLPYCTCKLVIKSKINNDILKIITTYFQRTCTNPKCPRCSVSCEQTETASSQSDVFKCPKCSKPRNDFTRGKCGPATSTPCHRCLQKCITQSNDISNIAILSPTRNLSAPLYTNPKTSITLGLASVFDFLRSLGIKINQLYDEVKEVHCNDTIKSVVIQPNAINLITYHGAKGMEFDVVIVLHAKNNLINTLEFTDEQHHNDQYLLYVACSRAISQMYVLCSCASVKDEMSCHFRLLETCSKERSTAPINHIKNFDLQSIKEPVYLSSAITIAKINVSQMINPNSYEAYECAINKIIVDNNQVTSRQIFQVPTANTIERRNSAELFGLFCEELFYYQYELARITSGTTPYTDHLYYEFPSSHITSAISQGNYIKLSASEFGRIKTVLSKMNIDFPKTTVDSTISNLKAFYSGNPQCKCKYQVNHSSCKTLMQQMVSIITNHNCASFSSLLAITTSSHPTITTNRIIDLFKSNDLFKMSQWDNLYAKYTNKDLVTFDPITNVSNSYYHMSLELFITKFNEFKNFTTKIPLLADECMKIFEQNIDKMIQVESKLKQPHTFGFDYKNITRELLYLVRIKYGYDNKHFYYCNWKCIDKDFIVNKKANKQLFESINRHICQVYQYKKIVKKTAMDMPVNQLLKQMACVNMGAAGVDAINTRLANTSILDTNSDDSLDDPNDDEDQSNAIQLCGEIDHYEVLGNNYTITEIKTTTSVKMQHYLQLLVYNLLMNNYEIRTQDQDSIGTHIIIHYKIINLLQGKEYTGTLMLTKSDICCILDNSVKSFTNPTFKDGVSTTP